MPNNQSEINDDELNQMIASLKGNAPSAAPAGQKIIQPPVAEVPAPPMPPTPPAPVVDEPKNVPVDAPAPNPVPMSPDQKGPVGNVNNLLDIKNQAITELRPLIDKLNISPEDKFDAILLLIRTTDDSSLIPMAHETAKQIVDDNRRAQALLDVIKEIDFFNGDK